MKTAILTDSGCGLTPQQAKEYGIYLVPLQVIDENVSYQDGLDMTTEDLYERLRQQHTPKTSMPNGESLEKVMKEIREAGYEDVVGVPLPSGLSSTGNAMRMAAEEEGLGFALLETYTTCDLQFHNAKLALEFAQQGLSKEDIVKEVEKKVVNSASLIVPNDIQHLKRGGRLTPVAAAAANLLKIKPILKIDPSTNGRIDVIDKVRTEKKAISKVVDDVCDVIKDAQGDIFVIHSDCLSKAEEIQEEIRKRCPNANVHCNLICAVISAHTGLDCIAIQYMKK